MDVSYAQRALALEVSTNPDKEHALVDYLCAKDRLQEGWYEIDPWDFVDDGTHRFNDESFRAAAIDQNKYVEQLHQDLKTSSEQLQQVGIDPAQVDALDLSFDRYMQIIQSLDSSIMKTSNNDRGSVSGGQDETLRKLPILFIHDTEFYVDLAKLQFRQVDNATNVISFYDVQDNGDHTAVLYDPKTKNAFQGTWGEMTAREDVVLVKLPPKEDLDFEYVMQQLNKRSEEMMQQRKQAGDTKTHSEEKNKKQSKRQGL